MDRYKTNTLTSTQSSIEINSVLKNTYLLLSMTLLFSAGTAWVGMVTGASSNIFLFLIAVYGSLFLTQALANSPWGIASTFLFTGSLGYFTAPLLNHVLQNAANGGAIIFTSLFATGSIFLALSMYVLVTRKNFSFMGGFLSAGIIIAFIVMLASVVFSMPMLYLACSGVFALISSGLILYHTSNIIHGGERNYILATISLYVALYNLFISLLHIFMAFSSRD